MIIAKIKGTEQTSSSNMIPLHSSQPQVTVSSSTTTHNDASRVPRRNALDVLSQMCGDPSPTVSSTSTSSTLKTLTIDEELSRYIAKATSGGDFQPFWNTHQSLFPRLAQLVRRYGIVPATSIASEAAFSVAGFIQRKQRSSLSPLTLQYSMVLKDRRRLEKVAKS
jgi:hypothetical protein